MKTQISKLAFILLATILILSCSKKEDEPAPTPPAESYTVPEEITLRGETHTSSIDVLVPDISINPCKTVWAIVEKKVGKLGFVIGNFNTTGGTLDKIVDPKGCVKMKFEGTLNALQELQYLIQKVAGGKIELVDKTYTFTSKIMRTGDPGANEYDIKAVWTKP